MSRRAGTAFDTGPVRWVDPLIDTGKPDVRWVFAAAACRPFGMVRLSADTNPVGGWGAGYRFDSKTISCFSHIHAFQLAALPVMPATHVREGIPTPDAYASEYRHEQECVRGGYYSVNLTDSGVLAELTATEHVGFHRYAFPSGAPAHLLFYLGAELGPTTMHDVFVRRTGAAELEGWIENAPTARRPKPCRVHFVVTCDVPFSAVSGWAAGKRRADLDSVTGADSGVMVRFPDDARIVKMKVSLSYVSAGGARNNAAAELPHWDFDRVCHETATVWNRWLGRIEVKGGSEADRIKLYTDLWRVLLNGHLAMDADGRYVDRTGPAPVVRQVPCDESGRPAWRKLENDFLWGAHWSLSLLWSLAWPEVVRDWCNTAVEMFRHGGLMPRGPSGGNYTFVMIGAHSTAFITAAYMRGIRNFDINTAYEGMLASALPGGLMSKAGYEHCSCIGGGIEHYIDQGYVPEGRNAPGAVHVRGAAQTLEYAFDDGCLALMAEALGRHADHQVFVKRSRNYRNLFDRSTGFMRPRNMDGSWIEPFDPLSMVGWVEANAWQYSWYVPHDIPGVVDLMGGDTAVITKLNGAFERAEAMDFYAPKPRPPRDKAYVNYGNEPGRFVAHLFNHAGAPWLTQKWARRIRRQTFGATTPWGFCEDDDNGLAAATSALLSLGLFDTQGGASADPVLEVTAPLFDEVTFHLDSGYHHGETFVINAQGNASNNPYVQSASLNGLPLRGPWFRFREFARGGRLSLRLSPIPNETWGVHVADRPRGVEATPAALV